MRLILFLVFFKQKTAYEMRISDWSSDVCSSDLKEERPFDKLRANGFDLSLWLCASQKKANRSNRPIIGYQRLRKACAGFADSSGQLPAIPIRKDRKSVVKGKSVSVRVDPGGRRRIKKKKNTERKDRNKQK